ncbi:MAG TPA: hypothetical protein VEF04_18735 [Blastocatellia bacterium]|nr:hypothetical protein [Blastocatellia bacterium]
MYLFTFLSRIDPKSEAAERLSNIGGAYVTCWINFKDYEASEELAKLLIRKSGWIAEKKTEESVVRKRFLKKRKDKQFYSEALKHGYTLIFNMWPKDAPDAEIDYESENKIGAS